jgi:hypothetical protein
VEANDDEQIRASIAHHLQKGCAKGRLDKLPFVLARLVPIRK